LIRQKRLDEMKSCVESGHPDGPKLRFTEPCGTGVALVHKGMWR